MLLRLYPQYQQTNHSCNMPSWSKNCVYVDGGCCGCSKGARRCCRFLSIKQQKWFSTITKRKIRTSKSDERQLFRWLNCVFPPAAFDVTYPFALIRHAFLLDSIPKNCFTCCSLKLLLFFSTSCCCCCCYCALCQCFCVCLLYNCWYFSAWNSFLGQINIRSILLCISLALLEKKCIPFLFYSLLLIFLGSVYYGNRYFSTKLNNFNKQTVISRWFSAYLFKFNQNN